MNKAGTSQASLSQKSDEIEKVKGDLDALKKAALNAVWVAEDGYSGLCGGSLVDCVGEYGDLGTSRFG